MGRPSWWNKGDREIKSGIDAEKVSYGLSTGVVLYTYCVHSFPAILHRAKMYIYLLLREIISTGNIEWLRKEAMIDK